MLDSGSQQQFNSAVSKLPGDLVWINFYVSESKVEIFY